MAADLLGDQECLRILVEHHHERMIQDGEWYDNIYIQHSAFPLCHQHKLLPFHPSSRYDLHSIHYPILTRPLGLFYRPRYAVLQRWKRSLQLGDVVDAQDKLGNPTP